MAPAVPVLSNPSDLFMLAHFPASPFLSLW
jgi:hypothetical protein